MRTSCGNRLHVVLAVVLSTRALSNRKDAKHIVLLVKVPLQQGLHVEHLGHGVCGNRALRPAPHLYIATPATWEQGATPGMQPAT